MELRRIQYHIKEVGSQQITNVQVSAKVFVKSNVIIKKFSRSIFLTVLILNRDGNEDMLQAWPPRATESFIQPLVLKRTTIPGIFCNSLMRRVPFPLKTMYGYETYSLKDYVWLTFYSITTCSKYYCEVVLFIPSCFERAPVDSTVVSDGISIQHAVLSMAYMYIQLGI